MLHLPHWTLTEMQDAFEEDDLERPSRASVVIPQAFDGFGSNLAVVPLTGKSVTATLPPGNYHVHVFARNSCGDSAKTADVSFAIP